jgi:hypothetical protein
MPFGNLSLANSIHAAKGSSNSPTQRPPPRLQVPGASRSWSAGKRKAKREREHAWRIAHFQPQIGIRQPQARASPRGEVWTKPNPKAPGDEQEPDNRKENRKRGSCGQMLPTRDFVHAFGCLELTCQSYNKRQRARQRRRVQRQTK